MKKIIVIIITLALVFFLGYLISSTSSKHFSPDLDDDIIQLEQSAHEYK